MDVSKSQIRSENPRAQSSEQVSSGSSSFRLHIDEMVLHGFPAVDQYRIGDAVQRELTRLLTEAGSTESVTRSAFHPSIEAGSIQIDAGLSAEAIGIKIAQSLHKGIRK